jgi:multiple sugar transport system substrate-binding protein
MSGRTITRRALLDRCRVGVLGTAAVGLLAACGGAAAVSSSSGTVAGSVSASTASGVASGASTTAGTTTASAPATATTTTASKAAVASTSAAAAVPTAPAGAVDFWQWGSGYVPGFNTLAENFNKSQKVQVAAANPSDYWNKVVTTQASGTGPDVFLMNNVNFKQWAHNKLVDDVSSYLNTDKTAAASLQAMTPSLVDWYHYQGKAMGVPWDFSAGIVGYNIDQLQAVGLTSPNDQGKKWDWNLMRDYATKLTQKSSSAITRSGIWINAGLENGYYSFCVANGGSFFNADLNQCTIATPEAIAGLDYVLTMLKDGIAATPAFMTTANKAVPTGGTAFTGGATAMDFEGDWNFTTWEKAKSLNWDATIFPYSPTTGKTANTSNLRGLVMNPQAKNKDNVWAWMAYLMSKPVQDQIPTLLGEIPANTASATANYIDPAKGGPPPGRKDLQPDLDATTPLPASDLISWNDIVKYAYGKPITDAFALQLPAADALKQVQDGVNAIITANKGK